MHESAEEKAGPTRHTASGGAAGTPQAAGETPGTASGMSARQYQQVGIPMTYDPVADDIDTDSVPWYPFP